MERLSPDRLATRAAIAHGMWKAILALSRKPLPRGRPGTPTKMKSEKTAMDGPTGHSVKSFYRALRRGWRPLEYEE